MSFDLAATLRGVSGLDTGNVQNRERIEYIRAENIVEDEKNFYSIDGIETLATNIEFNGLLDPLRVRPKDGTGLYIIVSGHRRFAAIQRLIEGGSRDFDQIPCIVDARNENTELQELRLIYANSDTRKMTPADVQRQAVRITELLQKLKGDGYEFRGRMRDHVAMICNVSSTRLARLDAIKNNLLPEIYKDWFLTAKISETVAYALSKLTCKRQTHYLGMLKSGWHLTEGMIFMDEQKELQKPVASDPAPVQERPGKSEDEEMVQSGPLEDDEQETEADEEEETYVVQSGPHTEPDTVTPKWIEGVPDKPGLYWVRLNFSNETCIYSALRFSGVTWTMRNGASVSNAGTITNWWPLPEDM